MKLAQKVTSKLKEAGENTDGFIKVKYENTSNNKAHLEKLAQQHAAQGITIQIGEGEATISGPTSKLPMVDDMLDPQTYTMELSY